MYEVSKYNVPTIMVMNNTIQNWTKNSPACAQNKKCRLC
jgi:hypothetical protein